MGKRMIMKLTLNQRQNILNGDRKIKEKANHAITVLIYGCETEGTFYSQRGPRFNRGVKIN